jgi:poly-beta-1,6-N-acetyl-D-glucosamine biosynthesis protein PgaD
MDKPGSRSPTDQSPLIISRPDLAHPIRRCVLYTLTPLAWFGWLMLWRPVFQLIGASLGILSPAELTAYSNQVTALRDLLDLFPMAIGFALLLLFLNGCLNKLYGHLRKSTGHNLQDVEVLAEQIGVEAVELASWQNSIILRVQHDLQGQVEGVEIVK